jgi:hypothetical protein
MEITLGDSNLFLKQQGYELRERFLGACFVQIAKKEKKVIAKREYISSKLNQVEKENQIYGLMGNLDRVPKKIKFYDLNNYDFQKKYEGKLLKPRILIKEYIFGKEYCDEQLSSEEEQKMFELVGNFHREGLAYLDLNKRNLILTPDRKLFYIDFGTALRKGEKKSRVIEVTQKLFDEFKMQDLRNLENILRGN